MFSTKISVMLLFILSVSKAGKRKDQEGAYLPTQPARQRDRRLNEHDPRPDDVLLFGWGALFHVVKNHGLGEVSPSASVSDIRPTRADEFKEKARDVVLTGKIADAVDHDEREAALQQFLTDLASPPVTHILVAQSFKEGKPAWVTEAVNAPNELWNRQRNGSKTKRLIKYAWDVGTGSAAPKLVAGDGKGLEATVDVPGGKTEAVKLDHDTFKEVEEDWDEVLYGDDYVPAVTDHVARKLSPAETLGARVAHWTDKLLVDSNDHEIGIIPIYFSGRWRENASLSHLQLFWKGYSEAMQLAIERHQAERQIVGSTQESAGVLSAAIRTLAINDARRSIAVISAENEAKWGTESVKTLLAPLLRARNNTPMTVVSCESGTGSTQVGAFLLGGEDVSSLPASVQVGAGAFSKALFNPKPPQKVADRYDALRTALSTQVFGQDGLVNDAVAQIKRAQITMPNVE